MAKRKQSKPASKATKKKPVSKGAIDEPQWRLLTPAEEAERRKAARVPLTRTDTYSWRKLAALLDRIEDDADAAAWNQDKAEISKHQANYARKVLNYMRIARPIINSGDLPGSLLMIMSAVSNYVLMGQTKDWDDIIKGRKAVDRGPHAAAVKSAKTDEVREWVRREYAATLTRDNKKAAARKRVIKAFPIKFPNKKVPADSTIENYVRTPRKARRK